MERKFIQHALDRAIQKGHLWVIYDSSRGIWSSVDDNPEKGVYAYPVKMAADEIYDEMSDYFEGMRIKFS